MEKIKLPSAIDVDGTIADLGAAWLNRYNKDYNDNLTNEDILSWDTHLYVKPECGKKIYEYLEDPTLYDEVLPIPYAIEAVNRLKKDLRIIFVTNSTVGASGAKYNWLIKYGFLTSLDDYVECKDKSLILATSLIDDRIENLMAFEKYGFGFEGYIYSQPWNKKLPWKRRILNWKDFLDASK